MQVCTAAAWSLPSGAVGLLLFKIIFKNNFHSILRWWHRSLFYGLLFYYESLLSAPHAAGAIISREPGFCNYKANKLRDEFARAKFLSQSAPGSVYNSFHTTEVPFGFGLHCYCCCEHSWSLVLLGETHQTLWFLQDVLRDQRATADTIMPSTYLLHACFTLIHLKAFTPGNPPVKPQASVQGNLWATELRQYIRGFTQV